MADTVGHQRPFWLWACWFQIESKKVIRPQGQEEEDHHKGAEFAKACIIVALKNWNGQILIHTLEEIIFTGQERGGGRELLLTITEFQFVLVGKSSEVNSEDSLNSHWTVH